MHQPVSSSRRFWLVALPLLAAGCSRSCGKEQPFVPYAIDPSSSSLSPTVASVSPSSPEGPSSAPPVPRFAPVVAQKVKPNTAQIPIGDGALRAPEGSFFQLLLKADLDDDKREDAVAWVASPDGKSGSLLYYAAPPSQAVALTTLPDTFATDGNCQFEPDLRQVGPHTVSISVRRSCAGPGGEAFRWMAVAVPSRQPAMRLSMEVTEPRLGEVVDLQVDGADRDGDHWDDVTVTASLAPGNSSYDEPNVEAPTVEVHYFDRPAGLSRDPHEPSASFRDAAGRLGRLSKSKKGCDAVLAGARKLRLLHRALCAEDGSPLVQLGGVPLQCGASDALKRADQAELDGALRCGDMLSALAVESRMRRPAAGYDAKRLEEAHKQIEDALGAVSADSYQLPFAPTPTTPQYPSWAGLGFDSTGALLIQTASSVMRFDPKTRVALADSETGAAPNWAGPATSPDQKLRFARVFDPCDGGSLRAQFGSGQGAGGDRFAALPLDPLQGKGCAHGAGPSTEVRAIAWSKQGIEALVNRVPVWISADLSKSRQGRLTNQPAPLGSPRSLNGRFLVQPVDAGLVLVRSEGGPQLWRVAEQQVGYGRLRDCTVSNDGAAIACIDGSSTRVFVPRSGAPAANP